LLVPSKTACFRVKKADIGPISGLFLAWIIANSNSHCGPIPIDVRPASTCYCSPIPIRTKVNKLRASPFYTVKRSIWNQMTKDELVERL
jgi:hypothetical protein